jgi:predicted SprT family Zn-dependent metalloprotease
MQLSLPLERQGQEPEDLRRYFEKALRRAVHLVLTDNSASLFTMCLSAGAARLRLHRMFLEAGEDVLHELAAYISGKTKTTPLFWRFVREHRHAIRRRPPRRVTLKPRGEWHHLGQIFQRLNEEYFDGKLRAGITWGSSPARRTARKRTLGSYSANSRTIRINPRLDRRYVPRYFIEYLVYHEMLHAHVGFEEKEGRRQVHTRRFKELEKRFRHYRRALAWEKKGLV